MSYNKWKNSKNADPVEYPFLTLVASPQTEHKLDLVFVHGLNPFGKGDHPTQTWTHENGNFWPRDLLPDDMPYARIFVFGYNSNVTNASTMSAEGIKEHAESLLNLLYMKRDDLGQTLSKIIFVGHSLGGLVIKQALVVAQRNSRYMAIRNATFGLVFFGCPHHGAKGIELGKIAAGVAMLVSEGRATNNLIASLEDNSLFTRDVSDQFCHQLEDYQVVSFFESMPMQSMGYGLMSDGKIAVERESAILGLAGSREVQVSVGADHLAMCKIKDRSARYELIQGNIKQLANKAITSIQGYIPPPTHMHVPPPSSFHAPPPLPTRPHSNASSSYAPPPPSGTMAKVTGSLFYPTGTDSKSIRLAELKNTGHWNEARLLEYEIFQEKMKTLGPTHLNTLNTGYDLACTYLELGLANDASKWIEWVNRENNSSLNREHNVLSLKAKSLQGEILQFQGDHTGCETLCATALINQQDSLAEDSLDILETLYRLAAVCNSLGRREEALGRLRKRVQILERSVGCTHILSIVAILDLIEITTNHHLGNQFGTAGLDSDVQSAARMISETYTDLKTSLGPRHQVSIRTLHMYGKIKIMQGEITEASDLLRRGLSYAEEILGVDHPLTIDLVTAMGIMHMRSQPMSFVTNGPPEMRPWFQRTLKWLEERKGLKNSETRMILDMLAMSYMGAKDYVQAEKYYERLAISYEGETSKEAQSANKFHQLCRANAMYIKKAEQKNSGSLASLFPGLGLR